MRHQVAPVLIATLLAATGALAQVKPVALSSVTPLEAPPGSPNDKPASASGHPKECANWIDNPANGLQVLDLRAKMRVSRLKNAEQQLSLAQLAYTNKPDGENAANLTAAQTQIKALTVEIWCDTTNIKFLHGKGATMPGESTGSRQQDINGVITQQNQAYEMLVNVLKKSDEARQNVVSKMK